MVIIVFPLAFPVTTPFCDTRAIFLFPVDHETTESPLARPVTFTVYLCFTRRRKLETFSFMDGVRAGTAIVTYAPQLQYAVRTPSSNAVASLVN